MITANATAPNQVGQNPFEQSAGLLGGAGDIYKNVASGGFLENINSYINPYYTQVLDAALGRMGQQKDIALGQLGDQAIASGAFGGSRQGVAEGTLLGDYNRNVGELTSQVSSNAFNTALQNLTQNQFNAASGMQGLGGNLFNIGQTITQGQAAAGGQQQDLMNQILQGGAGQFDKLVQSPYQMINLFQALLQGDPRNNAGQTEQQSTPGLFDYLSLFAQAAGGGG